MSDKFIIVQVHHGGHFVFYLHVIYEGDRVDQFINSDPNKMSMFELRDLYYDLVDGK